MKRTMKAVILAVIAAAGSISLSSCGKPLTPIDPFENLEVTFNGISGYTGSVETNDPEYEGSKYIYYYCPQGDDVLSNGDTITMGVNVVAEELKKIGYKVEQDTKEYTVQGLPEIPDELTEAEVSELSEELDLHLLYSSGAEPAVGDEFKPDFSWMRMFTPEDEEEINQRLYHGDWKYDQISDMEIDTSKYKVWKDKYNVYDLFYVVYHRDVTLKCTAVDEFAAEDENAPSVGDTVSFTWYYGAHRTGFCKENGAFADCTEAQISSSYAFSHSSSKEIVIEEMESIAPNNCECIISKEY